MNSLVKFLFISSAIFCIWTTNPVIAGLTDRIIKAAKEGVAKLKVEQKEKFRTEMEAAEKGKPSAQYYIGFAYERGIGVVKNNMRAASWYRRAAD